MIEKRIEENTMIEQIEKRKEKIGKWIEKKRRQRR